MPYYTNTKPDRPKPDRPTLIVPILSKTNSDVNEERISAVLDTQ